MNTQAYFGIYIFFAVVVAAAIIVGFSIERREYRRTGPTHPQGRSGYPPGGCCITLDEPCADRVVTSLEVQAAAHELTRAMGEPTVWIDGREYYALWPTEGVVKMET